MVIYYLSQFWGLQTWAVLLLVWQQELPEFGAGGCKRALLTGGSVDTGCHLGHLSSLCDLLSSNSLGWAFSQQGVLRIWKPRLQNLFNTTSAICCWSKQVPRTFQIQGVHLLMGGQRNMARETQFNGDHYSNNLSQWKWGQENRGEGRTGR